LQDKPFWIKEKTRLKLNRWYWEQTMPGRVLAEVRHGLTDAEAVAVKLGITRNAVDKIIKRRYGTTLGKASRGKLPTGYEDWPVATCKGCGKLPFDCPLPECVLEDSQHTQRTKTAERYSEIVKLKQQGRSVAEIAKMLEVSPRTVHRAVLEGSVC